MGCPKKEKWIDQSKAEINAVMVGVGAAFDYLAGTKPQAPLWVQKIGMEWFFRLLTEPTRLWRRYLRHNHSFYGRSPNSSGRISVDPLQSQ